MRIATPLRGRSHSTSSLSTATSSTGRAPPGTRPTSASAPAASPPSAGSTAPREAAYRCRGPSRRPGLHRHAGTIRAHPPGRPARALEGLPGHHDRDHRRRGIGRSRKRCDRARRTPRQYEHYGIKRDWTDFAGYFAHLERQGIGINLASYVGATTVREMVIGYGDRAATPAELEQMQASRRAGHAPGRRRGVERARVCARTVREHRGADRAREHRRPVRRDLRHAHALRAGGHHGGPR